MKTSELEQCIYWSLVKNGTYLCFEVMIPREIETVVRCGVGKMSDSVYHKMSRERVDLLQYEKNGTWRFYELKVSVSDFRSKCYNSFYGHYNYYVMPREIYDKVKDEIPDFVGCYCPVESSYKPMCVCVKRAKRRELAVDEDKLKFNFMQSLSRTVEHYQLQKFKEMCAKKSEVKNNEQKTHKKRLVKKKSTVSGSACSLFGE